jgi:hypothetical protein
MAYFTTVYGQPIAAPNFNRPADRGHDKLDNFNNNEFDPQDWRSEQCLQVEAKPPRCPDQDLQESARGSASRLE